MRYILLIYGEEAASTPEDREHCYEESGRLIQDIAACGHSVTAAPLHPTSMATSVRVRDGRRVVTDGPFAETKEQLGGYYLIDVNDLDEAISIASRVPAARWGTVEVRPIIELVAPEQVPT